MPLSLTKEKADKILKGIENNHSSLSLLIEFIPLTFAHPLYWVSSVIWFGIVFCGSGYSWWGAVSSMILVGIWAVPCTLCLGDLHLSKVMRASWGTPE